MTTQSTKHNWWVHIIFLFILVSLFAFAALYRTSDAITAISWGTRQRLCLYTSTFCSINRAGLTVNFGVYDPQSEFSSSSRVAFDHYFFDWRESVDLASTLKSGRWPLVTIEPWVEDEKRHTLLSDIASGTYDSRISDTCRGLGSYNHPIFVRFSHEMERVTGRYPWAVEDTAQFIQAYRHFVTLCRQDLPESYYVWSPAGEENSESYWPGHEYVDYVGLSIYHLPEYEKKTYGRTQSFLDLFTPKYNRVKQFDKPIILAEFGVIGEKSYQIGWLHQALTDLTAYPDVKTLVYFNAKDTPGVWGKDLATPDWHIDSQVFSFQ
ncbi:MAG: glycosyl hydrolase [Patescibacteria group bacterium]